jgi:RNA polymerase sigma-70 factor (family 1)
MSQLKLVITDDVLLRRIGQGNAEAFNLLYEKYWQQAYANAFKRLQDYDAAKDIVQEIFTHIWLKRETVQIENFPAYINIAVRNKVFKFFEKQKLQHPFFNILETIPATYLHTDANVLWKEFYKSYEALLDTLPEKRQVIFRKRYQDDLSTTEIASQLGLSRKTVQNQLGKALEQLRVSLFNLLSIMIVLLPDL